MRLEIESTVATPQTTDEMHDQDHVGQVSAEAKSMLSQGIKAAQSGNRNVARIALQRATELDPHNESAWLWLASISEYPEELLGFLNQVLEINPENQRAAEWMTATHALLSRTFVQRGIDACEENQKEFGAECFQTALEYDERNATAYVWMASLSDESAVKVGFLEKALEIEPGNELAANALEAAKKGIIKERLTEAKAAVVEGNNPEAVKILDALLAVTPDSVEAWTMKSHLADGFDEKIRCFETILAIDPENVAARSGRDSLLSIFGTTEGANTECSKEVETASHPLDPPYEMSIDKSPTQDLEMPEAIAESSFHDGIGTQPHPEATSEEENVDHPIQNDAEPFASYAEEIQEPSHVDFAPVSGTETPDPTPTTTEYENSPEINPPYASSLAETVAFSYDAQPEYVSSADPEPQSSSEEFEIPMPHSDLPEVPTAARSQFETTVEETSEPEAYISDTSIDFSEVVEARAESIECMFCHQANEPQSVTCHLCLAVLTLSDLELLLANHNADKMMLRQAVEQMERQRSGRDATIEELIALGIGHLNLRNLQMGYTCLADASKLDPNNVVLSGQVNSLLIRLDEIKQQEEAHLRMPKGKTILVVDDSPTVRKLIAGKLEKSGHEVICANDGVEAMESLETMVPDLILLDITMPRMDGYQACKNIRGKSSTKDVPIVMISGKDGFFDKVRGRMAGTTGYITKPFGPETLMKAVEMYLAGEAPDLDEEV